MFPYVEHPKLDLGFYTIEAFLVLVGLAIVVQFQIVLRRAPRFGFDRALVSSLVGWAILWGLVGAHVFDVVTYYPDTLRRNPWVLFELWGGLSSFGGMVGGLTGLTLVMRRKRLDRAQMIRFLDCLIFALPFTLATGRLGCALQHDHLGIASTHWLAVRFPDGSRFDLGLLEFLVVSCIAVAFLWLDRKPRPDGFFVGLFFALYGPVRFALDTLRIGDERYLGLTPAQYLSVVAFAGGASILWLAHRRSGAAGPTRDAVPGSATQSASSPASRSSTPSDGPARR